MNFLQTTCEISMARTFQTRARAADIVKLQHDHIRCSRLQPLIARVDELDGVCRLPRAAESEPEDWTHYRIVENVPWVIGSVTSDSWLKDTSDGYLSYVEAPLGLKVHFTSKVADVQGGVRIEETAKLEMNRLLMPFVVCQMTSAHEKMMENTVKEVEINLVPKT